jgi:hypothetical protein
MYTQKQILAPNAGKRVVNPLELVTCKDQILYRYMDKLQNKIKGIKFQQGIFGFYNMIKVDPGAILFTRGFSLEHIAYGG